METQHRNNTICCIDRENMIECCVYFFGAIHQAVFIVLIVYCSMFINAKDNSAFFIILLIFSLLGFLSSLCSIVGTALKNNYLILPWLIFGIVPIFLEFVNLYNLFSGTFDGGSTATTLCFIVLSVSFWISNLFIYMKIRDLQEDNYNRIDPRSEENINTTYNSIA